MYQYHAKIRKILKQMDFEIIHYSPDRILTTDSNSYGYTLLHLIQSELPVSILYLNRRFKAWNNYRNKKIEIHIAVSRATAKKSLLKSPESIPFKFILLFNSTTGLIKLSNVSHIEKFYRILNLIKKLVKPMKGTKEITFEPTPLKSLKRKIIIDPFKFDFKGVNYLYLGTANLAKQSWCQQQFIFLTHHEHAMFKEEITELEKRNKFILQKRIKPSILEFNRKELENVTLLDFLKKVETIRIRLGKGSGLEKLTHATSKTMKKKYEKPFLDWKEKLLNNNKDKFFYFPKSLLCLLETSYTFQISPNLIAHIYGEKHKTTMKPFTFKKLKLLAEPDGISSKYCYEFKTTKSRYYFYYQRPVAINQALLYSYFFKKPYYKVQFYIRENNSIETIFEKTDRKEAERLLIQAEQLAFGKLKPIPPKPFKCKTCGFREGCKIYKKIKS